MRPLPRVLAYTDDRVSQLDDLGVRAAALAAVGPAIALIARRPAGTTDQLATLAQRFVALVTPPMATVFVTSRSDVALATGATGVILRRDDLGPAEVRRIAAAPLAIYASVHAIDEAESAVASGVDALIVGAIWDTASHPGRAAAGTTLLHDAVSLGVPVYAIGGVTAARAREAQATGAWGVAAITSLWDVADPYRAAVDMAGVWSGR